MNPVWTNIILVLGTLGGGLLSGWIQYRRDKAQREDANLQSQRDNAVAAVAELKKALDRHRAQMWKFRNAHHTGGTKKASAWIRALLWMFGRGRNAGSTQLAGLDQTHETRSAISEPLTRVRLYMRSLTPKAKAAADAVYAMRNSKDLDHLEVLRLAALTAADEFVAEASNQFALLGIGLTLPTEATQQKALSSTP